MLILESSKMHFVFHASYKSILINNQSVMQMALLSCLMYVNNSFSNK